MKDRESLIVLEPVPEVNIVNTYKRFNKRALTKACAHKGVRSQRRLLNIIALKTFFQSDEDTLATMMKMIQDPELAEKYPMVAAMQNKSQEAKGDNSRFLQMLRGCGFEKMIALMSKFNYFKNVSMQLID